MKRSCLALLVLSLTLAAAFQIDSSKISVSGLSAGGFFAAQYFVAHSAELCGAGIVAGGPYYCAQGDMTTATTDCMSQPEMLDLKTYINAADRFASEGKIDATSNIRSKPVWLYSGQQDYTVYPGVVKVGQQFFEHFNARIGSEYGVESGHCLATKGYGNDCPTSFTPWINDCQYSAAEKIFEHIHGPAKHSVQAPADTYEFDQGKYTEGSPQSISLSQTGYYYIPPQCRHNGTDSVDGNSTGTACGLHISFHGCNQGATVLGDEYVTKTQYLEHAQARDIIVVFPQVQMDLFMNPSGCFDWWGYTNEDYAVKSGPQMKFVERIISTLRRGAEL